MANFCKYCGKALQDGEICTCPQAQAEAAQQYQGQPQQPPQEGPYQGYQPQQPPQEGPYQGYPPQEDPYQGYQPQQPPQEGPYQGYQPQQPPQGYPPQPPAGPSPVAVGLQRIPSFLQAYLKAPVSAVQSLVNTKDMIVAGALLLVQVIICGLLLFAPLKSMSDSFTNYATSFFGGGDYSKLAIVAGSGLAVVNEDFNPVANPSYAMSLLMGILIAVICVAAYVAVIFAAAKISGAQITFVDAVIAAGGHSIYVTGLLVLSFLAFFIMFELGAILFTVAMLAWIVLTPPAIQAIAPPSTTKEGTLWICTTFGVAIAVVVCGWISALLLTVPF